MLSAVCHGFTLTELEGMTGDELAEYLREAEQVHT